VLFSVSDLHTYFLTARGLARSVDGISFDVDAGEMVALVGESGSGKSVTALSIQRLIPQPPGRIVRGSVTFEGRDLLALSAEQMRQVRGARLGMIFQEPMTSLNPVLTVGRQVTEPMEEHLGLTPRQAESRAVELLSSVGISDPKRRLDAYPHQFSGGMRQRIMIAMAISCAPSLLIADEPTTALDVTIQAQILHLLRGLTKEQGTAVLLITHDLGLVARYADRVNVMYAGRIVEQGSVDRLFADPRHPYTRGLLDSVPRLDRLREDKLFSISGSPPDIFDLPGGCAFRPRCPFADDRCAAEPALTRDRSGHSVACWRSDELDMAREAAS
jgi:oligopeptide/dipeptide ABC transporter ATP-binding protein